MLNHCAWPHEHWTWITSSVPIGRDPEHSGLPPRSRGIQRKWRPGLKLTVRAGSLGTKPKGHNNDTVDPVERGLLAEQQEGLSGYTEDNGEGRVPSWHGHYQRCQHESDRCSKLILTSNPLGNRTKQCCPGKSGCGSYSVMNVWRSAFQNNVWWCTLALQKICIRLQLVGAH